MKDEDSKKKPGTENDNPQTLDKNSKPESELKKNTNVKDQFAEFDTRNMEGIAHHAVDLRQPGEAFVRTSEDTLLGDRSSDAREGYGELKNGLADTPLQTCKSTLSMIAEVSYVADNLYGSRMSKESYQKLNDYARAHGKSEFIYYNKEELKQFSHEQKELRDQIKKAKQALHRAEPERVEDIQKQIDNLHTKLDALKHAQSLIDNKKINVDRNFKNNTDLVDSILHENGIVPPSNKWECRATIKSIKQSSLSVEKKKFLCDLVKQKSYLNKASDGINKNNRRHGTMLTNTVKKQMAEDDEGYRAVKSTKETVEKAASTSKSVVTMTAKGGRYLFGNAINGVRDLYFKKQAGLDHKYLKEGKKLLKKELKGTKLSSKEQDFLNSYREKIELVANNKTDYLIRSQANLKTAPRRFNRWIDDKLAKVPKLQKAKKAAGKAIRKPLRKIGKVLKPVGKAFRFMREHHVLSKLGRGVHLILHPKQAIDNLVKLGIRKAIMKAFTKALNHTIVRKIAGTLARVLFAPIASIVSTVGGLLLSGAIIVILLTIIVDFIPIKDEPTVGQVIVMRSVSAQEDLFKSYINGSATYNYLDRDISTLASITYPSLKDSWTNDPLDVLNTNYRKKNGTYDLLKYSGSYKIIDKSNVVHVGEKKKKNEKYEVWIEPYSEIVELTTTYFYDHDGSETGYSKETPKSYAKTHGASSFSAMGSSEDLVIPTAEGRMEITITPYRFDYDGYYEEETRVVDEVIVHEVPFTVTYYPGCVTTTTQLCKTTDASLNLIKDQNLKRNPEDIKLHIRYTGKDAFGHNNGINMGMDTFYKNIYSLLTGFIKNSEMERNSKDECTAYVKDVLRTVLDERYCDIHIVTSIQKTDQTLNFVYADPVLCEKSFSREPVSVPVYKMNIELYIDVKNATVLDIGRALDDTYIRGIEYAYSNLNKKKEPEFASYKDSTGEGIATVINYLFNFYDLVRDGYADPDCFSEYFEDFNVKDKVAFKDVYLNYDDDGNYIPNDYRRKTRGEELTRRLYLDLYAHYTFGNPGNPAFHMYKTPAPYAEKGGVRIAQDEDTYYTTEEYGPMDDATIQIANKIYNNWPGWNIEWDNTIGAYTINAGDNGDYLEFAMDLTPAELWNLWELPSGETPRSIHLNDGSPIRFIDWNDGGMPWYGNHNMLD